MAKRPNAPQFVHREPISTFVLEQVVLPLGILEGKHRKRKGDVHRIGKSERRAFVPRRPMSDWARRIEKINDQFNDLSLHFRACRPPWFSYFARQRQSRTIIQKQSSGRMSVNKHSEPHGVLMMPEEHEINLKETALLEGTLVKRSLVA